MKDLIFVLLLLITSCNGVGTVRVTQDGQASSVGGSTPYNNMGFAGITSIDQKSDTTVRINWNPHAEAVAYELFILQPSGHEWLRTITGQSSSSVSLTGLLPNHLYKFVVKAMDSKGILDANNTIVSVTMNAAPNVPSGLSLVTPTVSPGLIRRPVIQVSGVKSGDTIKLFSDSDCSVEVATGVASGTSIDLKLTAPLSDGVYTFFANARNGLNISACSSSSVAYTKNSCPSGFIPVLHNSSAGTATDFCVMKFEAKNVGAVATAQANLTPWVSISRSAASTACTNLGANYDLISNPEWMTIALDIEASPSNWSLGTLGGVALFRGHTDNSPAAYLAVSDENNPYDGTSNASTDAMYFGKEQKRTYTLSNDEVIWDFSGNVWEWVDWSMTPGLDPAPTTCTGGLMQLNVVSCGALAASDYSPGNPAGIPFSSYDSNFGIGFYNSGSTGTAARGGGASWGAAYSGVFTLNLSFANGSNPGIGFRCVYRP